MTNENTTVDIAGLSATDAIDAINAGAFTPEQLAGLRTLEEQGKARKTVLAAIDAALAPAAPPVPSAGTGSASSSASTKTQDGKPPHKPNCEVPDGHDGAPCTNCGVSEIVWDGGAARCTYCNYRWS